MGTLLKGATVADGTGDAARRVDVRIDGDRISAVGDLQPHDDDEVIDLDGLVLAPGVVDIHTHYDAQVFWDGDLTPSSWHGVTTVLQGNCGFGIAPARPEDRELIMETLQLVEGMNIDTLRQGIRWEFQTYPEYLDVIREIPKRINIAAMVPHSMLRLWVMGAEAAFSRSSTEDELEQITTLLSESLAAGAIGFSTSQAPSHQGPEGRPVPSRFADRREIVAMLEAVKAAGRDGIVEITYGPLFTIEECADLATETGVRITWGSVIPGLFGPPGAAQDMLDRGTSGGADLWPQTSTRFISTQMSWLNPYQWSRVPAFEEVLGRTPDEMAKSYADPEWRTRAREQAMSLTDQKDFLDGDIAGYFDRTSVEETDIHADLRGIPLSRLADERGVHPFDLMMDLALEDNLQTRFRTVSPGSVEELRALVTDRRTVLGAHDGGAHVDMLCDSCYPSFMLRYWVREQHAMDAAEAAYRLSGQPAALFGLTDRGTIEVGKVADLIAYDADLITELPAERVWDFPADADRLIARGEGLEYVWVAGTAIRERGDIVEGAMPGQLISR
jgi:N-acyl-D-amino-acid deacylase